MAAEVARSLVLARNLEAGRGATLSGPVDPARTLVRGQGQNLGQGPGRCHILLTPDIVGAVVGVKAVGMISEIAGQGHLEINHVAVECTLLYMSTYMLLRFLPCDF